MANFVRPFSEGTARRKGSSYDNQSKPRRGRVYKYTVRQRHNLPFWEKNSGEQYEIWNMTDEHLDNTIRMLERQAEYLMASVTDLTDEEYAMDPREFLSFQRTYLYMCAEKRHRKMYPGDTLNPVEEEVQDTPTKFMKRV